MIFKADLHTHTMHSDGELSTEQLFEYAKKCNLQGLSITDHDTVAAYQEAFVLSDKFNIPVIAGIELSAYHAHTTVHVLGFGFNLNANSLLKAIQTIKESRIERIQFILERLRKRKIVIEFDEICREFPMGTLGRPHIASIMVKKGYVKTFSQAFNDYLNDTQLGSVTLKVLSAEEAIALIKEANGYAVLAHPCHIAKPNKLKKILQLQFDGIELYSGNINQEKVSWLTNQIKDKNFFVTGGSDFHKKQSPLYLGISYTCEEIFSMFQQKCAENNKKLLI